ncbi:MAG: sulfurtransferase [Verrucomicrobia bacterium]|nr:MAG: sulfurtransferase [Verrucomicrobiota bacterium]
MLPFINLSGYHFLPLKNLPELKENLESLCANHDLKGTILLSLEGINFFVAGGRSATDQLLAELRSIPGCSALEVKESESSTQPFRRMLIKIKKEIISFGVEGIDPASNPAPKLPPKKLKEWLDAKKPVVLLDTRNDYEVRMGTFQGALPAGIQHFRDFPEAVKKFPEVLKEATVVTFCTGGIRCEKAAPLMEREGFKNIFQLDGGILNYFKECGDAHYEGECFVFDKRVCLDPDLQETKSFICFKCQMPLKEEDQAHPHYKVDVSCPYCVGREKKKKAPNTRKTRRLKLLRMSANQKLQE